MKTKKQWADEYKSSWYKHYDGKPPLNDDNYYRWTGFQWVIDDNENENEKENNK